MPTKINNTFQALRPVEGQDLIVECIRHPKTGMFNAVVKGDNDGRRFIDCPTCGRRYVFTSSCEMEMHNFISDYNGDEHYYEEQEIERTPLQGHFYSDRKLEVYGEVEKELVIVQWPNT